MQLPWRLLFGPVIAALLLAVAGGATPALANSVVGDGSPTHCHEADFDTALLSGGLITFNCGSAPVTIVFSNQKLISTGSVTIDGGGLITLSGNDTTSLFAVAGTYTLILQNLVLEKGNSGSSPGGAVYNYLSTLILDHTVIQDSQTTNQPGGAIDAYGGSITLINHSLIQNNHGYNYGAINTTGSLTIQDSILRYNSATFAGGALCLGGPTVINQSQIYSNTANGESVGGAGLYLTAPSVVEITATQIYSNSAFVGLARGGGIKNFGALTVNNSSINGNYADYGGGLSNEAGATATLDQVTLNGNSASEGGAVDNQGALTLTQATLSGNQSVSGGGLENKGGAATVVNSTFSGNQAAGGNGAGVDNTSGLTLINDTLSGNLGTKDPFGGSVVTNGGGLATTGGPATLTNVTFSGNTALHGGGIYYDAVSVTNSLTVTNTIVADSLPGGNCYVDPSSVQNFTSAGFNLSSDTSCEADFNQGGDQNNLPALLFPLANNGGPTLTHLPQHASFAVDNGPGAGCPATDQRGLPRPSGAACDIGAVEVQPTDLSWPLYLPALRR